MVFVSYGLSREPVLVRVFDANVPADGMSSVPSPAGTLQGVRVHVMVELAVPHCWGVEGVEGSAGLNGRGLVQEGGWGCGRVGWGLG